MNEPDNALVGVRAAVEAELRPFQRYLESRDADGGAGRWIAEATLALSGIQIIVTVLLAFYEREGASKEDGLPDFAQLRSDLQAERVDPEDAWNTLFAWNPDLSPFQQWVLEASGARAELTALLVELNVPESMAAEGADYLAKSIGKAS